MPTCLCVANSNLVVANDIKWMANYSTTIYTYCYSQARECYSSRRWIATVISVKKGLFLLCGLLMMSPWWLVITLGGQL